MAAPRGTSVARLPRRAATASCLLVPAGALVLGVPSTALARDGLVITSPATVAEAPDSLDLDFTGEPSPLGTLVAVAGPDGHPLSGTFDLTVAEGDAAPAPAATSQVSAGARSDEEADAGIAPVWPAVGAVVGVGLGAVTVTRLRRRG